MSLFTHTFTRLIVPLSVLAATIVNGAFSSAEETTRQWTEIGPGLFNLDTRLRYEHNQVDGVSKDVDGLGLRTRLGYTWEGENDVSSQIELEDLRFIESDNRPPLDVPTTEINQAWIDFGGLKLGRQVYTLDDHRFIGHVGWRQNIQSFDAATGSFKPDSSTQLNMGYLHAVRRVNATTQDLDGVLFNATRSISEGLALTAFAYLLDFERPLLASSDTVGLRATGNIKNNDNSIGYAISYATQKDNSSSAAPFDLAYFAGEITAPIAGATFGLGFESLEGNGISGFSTPLATVHKFNGFADQFAGPSLGLGGGLSQGLRDVYARYTYQIPNLDIPITIAYHHFETQNVSDYLGDEWDLVATYKTGSHSQIMAKFAIYRGDGAEHVSYGAVDKTVFTFEFNVKY